MEILSTQEIEDATSSMKLNSASSALQNDNETEETNVTDDDFEENVITSCNIKKKNIIDSESEDDDVPLQVPGVSEQENVFDAVAESRKMKRKKIVIVSDEDDDSDIEHEHITPHNKSFSDDGMKSSEPSNSKEHVVSQGNATAQTYKLAALCDPESSEDERNDQIDSQSNLDEEVIEPKQYKSKRKVNSHEAENPKKMTGKDAAKLRKEIKSESQRMVRETNIALPYHKPKAFTLKEFLARRPKLSLAGYGASRTPPSVAMKMSKEQLEIVAMKLTEREQEVKKFYKSESESEDDEGDEDYAPPGAEEKDTVATEVQEATHLENVSREVHTANETAAENQDLITDDKEVTDLMNATSEENEEVKENVSLNQNTEQILEGSIVEMQENETVSASASKPGHIHIIHHVILNNIEKDKEVNECNAETVESNVPVVPKDVEPNTMNYEFNLDDLEDNSEREVPEEITSRKSTELLRDIQYTDLDKEIEEFGEKNVEKCDESIPHKKLSKLELIKEQLANIKPKLSGSPDDVIDLETGVVKPNEVSKLMERFAHHNFKKQTHKNNVKLNIVSIESGEIHKETVAMNVEDEDLTAIEEIPGVRFKKLRDELQKQMALKRSELWQKRTLEDMPSKDDTYENEKEHYEEDVIDDEEEEQAHIITHSSEEESDNEEDDTRCNGKKTNQLNKKNYLIAEEAEESEREDDNASTANSDDEGMAADVEDDEESIFEGDLIEDENSEPPILTDKEDEDPPKKTLKRILRGFTEDSDDEEECSTSNPADFTNDMKIPSYDLSQDDDDSLPPHQPRHCETPVKQLTQTKSAFDFLTPISYMTGPQNLNASASNLSRDSPMALTFHTAGEPSPLKENNWHHSLQKKLFTEREISQESQMEEMAAIGSDIPGGPGIKNTDENASVNEEELLNICSGKFPSTLEAEGNEAKFAAESEEKLPHKLELQNVSDDVPPSTQDLLNICSGGFTGVPQSEVNMAGLSNDEPPSTQELLNICSGAFTGITQNIDKAPQSLPERYVFNANAEIKSLGDDQDLIISQLVDEEEMEKFKRRFDSPLLPNTQKRIVEEFEEVMGTGGVIDSDDDDVTIEVKKKKNQKKLTFSDDEDSDEDGQEEEIINLHDEDEESDENNENVQDVCYDSEENEIELLEEEGIPKKPAKLRASDFFEDEAELSESEWGSADEDEKDLDTMEFELGDDEKFDEKKMKTDLEKIHMRRLLDDDTREVKLLQELLLEDGELHGTGRERQFRWKNIDSVDNEGEERKADDEIYLDDEESEEQWRKKRHEREMFLKEKSFNYDDNDLLSKSQLLKTGHKVIQMRQNSQSVPPVEKENTTASPVLMRSLNILNKRGSFLTRGDQVLQRLAEYSKVSSVAMGTAKNSRNFLFQTVSVKETSISSTSDKKRKAEDGTPKAFKKLRLSNSFSPAVKEKQLN